MSTKRYGPYNSVHWAADEKWDSSRFVEELYDYYNFEVEGMLDDMESFEAFKLWNCAEQLYAIKRNWADIPEILDDIHELDIAVTLDDLCEDLGVGSGIGQTEQIYAQILGWA